MAEEENNGSDGIADQDAAGCVWLVALSWAGEHLGHEVGVNRCTLGAPCPCTEGRLHRPECCEAHHAVLC